MSGSIFGSSLRFLLDSSQPDLSQTHLEIPAIVGAKIFGLKADTGSGRTKDTTIGIEEIGPLWVRLNTFHDASCELDGFHVSFPEGAGRSAKPRIRDRKLSSPNRTLG
jgi:hypothetical protein